MIGKISEPEPFVWLHHCGFHSGWNSCSMIFFLMWALHKRFLKACLNSALDSEAVVSQLKNGAVSQEPARFWWDAPSCSSGDSSEDTDTHPQCCCSPCLTESRAGCESSWWHSPYSDCCHQRSCNAGNYRPLVCSCLLQSLCARSPTKTCIRGASLHWNWHLTWPVKDFSIIPTILKWVRYWKGSQWCLDSINFCYVHCLVRPVFEMCHYMMCSLRQPHHLLLPVLGALL